MLFGNALVLTAVWFVLLAPPAQAYYDLSFTTYLVQIGLAFAGAVWLAMRNSMRKLTKVGEKKDDLASSNEAAADSGANPEQP